MTPTIDDVIRRITEDLNEQIKSVVIQEKTIKVIIYKYLKALQLPPSQHLKDEPTQTLQDFAANQMNVDDMKKDGSFINKVEDNEPLPESKSKNILQNWQPKVDWSEWDDIQYYRHDGYGWGRRIPGKLKQWVKAIIHAWDIHGIVNFGEIRKPVFEEELKQSTPKIDWVYKTKIYWICVCWKDHSKIEKTKDIEATIQLILDKINSLDQ